MRASDEPWSHHEAVVNGVRLHYVEAGGGPAVLLLHGFPEFWYSWRRQIPALASAGFRAVAPDLRGYNESEKPPAVASYSPDTLVEDVACLVREVGGRACVAGHDWGGVLAWGLAARHPGLVERLAVLNAPHPAAYLRELRGPAQWVRSWYVFFFQLPWLPERLLRAGDYALLRRVLRRQSARRGAFTPADVARYKEALDRPGALTAALNYYRAAFRHPLAGVTGPHTVRVPTLLVWGMRDPYLGPGLTEGLGKWVPDLRVARLPGVGHWVQNEEPEQVNSLLIEFFRGRGAAVTAAPAARGTRPSG
jgi:epoxide hydrolase 4